MINEHKSAVNAACVIGTPWKTILNAEHTQAQNDGQRNRKEKDTIRVIPGDEFSDGIVAAACSMQGWRYGGLLFRIVFCS